MNIYVISKKLVLVLFLGIVSVSCSTDDEEPGVFSGNVKASDIEGVWTVTEFYTENGKINTKISGVDVTANFQSDGKNFKNSKITFTQNPDVVTSTGTFTNTTTVSYLTFSQTEDSSETIPIAGTWSIANNIVSMGVAPTFLEYTIIDFTQNTLKLKYRYIENVEVVSGITGDATATIFITVTR